MNMCQEFDALIWISFALCTIGVGVLVYSLIKDIHQELK